MLPQNHISPRCFLGALRGGSSMRGISERRQGMCITSTPDHTITSPFCPFQSTLHPTLSVLIVHPLTITFDLPTLFGHSPRSSPLSFSIPDPIRLGLCGWFRRYGHPYFQRTSAVPTSHLFRSQESADLGNHPRQGTSRSRDEHGTSTFIFLTAPPGSF